MEDAQNLGQFGDYTELQFKAINAISLLLALALLAVGYAVGWIMGDWRWGVPIYGVAMMVLFGLKIAQEWERAVILRLGRFRRVAGPGLFCIIPLVDHIAAWIDHRVMVSPIWRRKNAHV